MGDVGRWRWLACDWPTTDDAEEEAFNWDLGLSDSGKARRSALVAKASFSFTTSSPIDVPADNVNTKNNQIDQKVI
jgi:hypothetical protein